MNFIDYKDYMHLFAEGGELYDNSDFSISSHFRKILAGFCTEAICHGKREFVTAFASSRDSLAEMFDLASNEYGADISGPDAASVVMRDVMLTLIKESAYNRLGYTPTADDIEFLCATFPELREPVIFAQQFNIYETSFPEILSYGRHKHIASDAIWPEEKIGVLFMLGLHLDDSQGSVGNHKHFSRRLIENPIISGLNRAFTRGEPVNHFINKTLDSYKTDAYKGHQILRIVEARAGSYLGFLAPDGDNIHSGGDFSTDLDPNFIEAVHDLLNEALHLSIENLVSGHGGNSESINEHRLAISCLSNISELSDYTATHFCGPHKFQSLHDLITQKAKIVDVVNELIVNSHAILELANRIEELAAAINNPDEMCEFLNLFGHLCKGEVAFNLEVDVGRINYQAAFVDYPFTNLEKMAIEVLNCSGNNSENSSLFQFLVSSPMPLVCRVIQNISDIEQFRLAMSALNLRLTTGCYECLPVRGLDLSALAITQTYALAENRLPKFGKTSSLMDVHECFGFDNEDLLRQHLELFNKEKGDTLNAIASAEQADLGFLTKGMSI